jgi:hypothetical protein
MGINETLLENMMVNPELFFSDYTTDYKKVQKISELCRGNCYARSIIAWLLWADFDDEFNQICSKEARKLASMAGFEVIGGQFDIIYDFMFTVCLKGKEGIIKTSNGGYLEFIKYINGYVGLSATIRLYAGIQERAVSVLKNVSKGEKK